MKTSYRLSRESLGLLLWPAHCMPRLASQRAAMIPLVDQRRSRTQPAGKDGMVFH